MATSAPNEGRRPLPSSAADSFSSKSPTTLVQAAMTSIDDRGGRIDVLINKAAIGDGSVVADGITKAPALAVFGTASSASPKPRCRCCTSPTTQS